jgi:hypothetical protein
MLFAHFAVVLWIIAAKNKRGILEKSASKQQTPHLFIILHIAQSSSTMNLQYRVIIMYLHSTTQSIVSVGSKTCRPVVKQSVAVVENSGKVDITRTVRDSS